MNSKFEFRIDSDLKQDFVRICELQDEVPSKVLRGMIKSYVADNISDYELYIEPFIAECEEILSQKIDEALEKDELVSYLTDRALGANINDVRLIDLMLDDLKNFDISYDVCYDEYNFIIWENGEICTDITFTEPAEYVEYFLNTEVL